MTQVRTKRKPTGREKDYLAIAKKRVVQVRQMSSYPKLLIYARNKIGKSKFAFSAGVEKTLVLDPEQGMARFRRLNPFVWPITRWEDMDEAWGALRTGELSPRILKGPKYTDEPFSWVSVDGLTKLNHMALNYVRYKQEELSLEQRPGFIKQSYYRDSGDLMKQMLINFHNLKMGVVYTAQQRMLTTDVGDSEEEEESVYFVPDVPAAVRGAVNSLVDVIGRLYIVKVTLKSEKEVKQRRLWIGNHDRYDTGFRSDYEVPDMVKNPTVDKIVNLIHTGDEKGAAV